MRRSTHRISNPLRRDGIGRRRFSHAKQSHSKPHYNVTSSPSKPPSLASSSNVAQTADAQSRLDRFLKRTPKVLHRHVSALRSAPVTHVSAFLILHEITAVVPLFGLAGAFHYYNWLPSYFSEGAWVVAGVERFGRYFRRKGWISDEQEQQAERLTEQGKARKVEESTSTDSSRLWTKSEGGVRVVVEFATAYAIVKALLIPRLIVSAWAAPWFARWTVAPALGMFRRVLGRGKGAAKNV